MAQREDNLVGSSEPIATFEKRTDLGDGAAQNPLPAATHLHSMAIF
jgi:hypothetical protein